MEPEDSLDRVIFPVVAQLQFLIVFHGAMFLQRIVVRLAGWLDGVAVVPIRTSIRRSHCWAMLAEQKLMFIHQALCLLTVEQSYPLGIVIVSGILVSIQLFSPCRFQPHLFMFI